MDRARANHRTRKALKSDRTSTTTKASESQSQFSTATRSVGKTKSAKSGGGAASGVTSATASRKGSLLALAILAFRKPLETRTRFLIPKDHAAWLEHLVHLVRRNAKTGIHFLGDKDIEKVIERWRTTTVGRKEAVSILDPDLPQCYSWNPEQIAEWVEQVAGYPQYKGAFLTNYVTGRKLIHVDASALNKMGIQYFSDITDLAGKIRTLLATHRPNILRALARIVPYEKYLKYRSATGTRASNSTFEQWCQRQPEHFPYPVLRKNKCALIACICEVLIHRTGLEDESEASSESESDISLRAAPTVEFTVRHILLRDRLVKEILDALIKAVFEPQKPGAANNLAETIRELLEWGASQLYSEEEIMERIEFAKSVGAALMEEVKRTAEVLRDIQMFQRQQDSSAAGGDAKHLKAVGEEFVEEVTAIAAMLASGELDIENVFREEPEFHQFVDGVIADAEERLTEALEEGHEVVQDVLQQAKVRLMEVEVPGMSAPEARQVKKMGMELLDEILGENPVAHEVDGYEESDNFLPPAPSKEFHEPHLKHLELQTSSVGPPGSILTISTPRANVNAKRVHKITKF